jgi:exonuclease VII small subunit
MGLKFRRGTTAQKSGSLNFGEPYVNTTLGTLQIGGEAGDVTLLINSSSQGISGSSLDITGNAKIDGNLTLGGAITIGDASADTVNVIASLSSSLIPQTSNAFDLGSATKIWRDLYISTGSIKFVEGNSVVKTLSAATLTALETSTGSANVSVAALNSFTSSQLTQNSALATISGSLISTASANVIAISNLNTTTASLNTSVTNINSTTASLNTSVTNLNSFSGSQLTQNSALATISGSLISSASAAKTTNDSQDVSVTNINSTTASLNTSVTNINSTTASLNTSVSNLNTATSSYETKGRSIVSGSAQIDGSLLGSNKTITIGSTSTTLGGTSTTIAGLTSVTSTAFVGALTGNASTVTTNANLTGNVTSVGNATTIASGVVTSDMIVDGTIVNGDINASAAIVDTKLATISTGGKVSNSATTATSANTVSAIVARDGSGNFSAGTITAALTGNASTATTAAALTTARTINGTSFDGSANITIPNLVSGSSQITYASIASIPAGIVSGSTQVTPLLPTGTVSGSSQVTLSSTTGYGTVINQNLLTTSDVRHNSLGIGMAASATAGRIDASGDVVAYSTSDINFKENITPIESPIEKIKMISGNTYDWKADMKEFHGFEGNDVGVIAQEIEAVLPQLVTTRETGYKAVKYDKLVALLIEGIKEQQTQIEKLRMDLDNYECKCDNCKSK